MDTGGLIFMIYTSYFGKLKTLPNNIIPISICAKAPDGYNGLQYKKVAPKYGFFNEWKKNGDNEYYIEHFNKEVLDCLSAKQVYDDLERISNGRDCVLLCYEKSSGQYVREQKKEVLDKINRLGNGPGGLRGKVTAFAVNIETYPTHIAGLPLAVNMCCHVNRHSHRVI